MLHHTSREPESQIGVGAKADSLADQDRQEDPVELLRELHRLLEDYSPTWYHEVLHARTSGFLSAFSPR